jgi:hypothetical protein
LNRLNLGNRGPIGLGESRRGLEKEVEEVPDISGIETNVYLAPYNPLNEEIVERSIQKVEAGSCYVSVFFDTRFDTSGYVEVPNSERKPARIAFLRALDVFSKIAQKRGLDNRETELIIQIIYEDNSKRPELEKYYEQLAKNFKDVTVYCNTFSGYEKELKESQ